MNPFDDDNDNNDNNNVNNDNNIYNNIDGNINDNITNESNINNSNSNTLIFTSPILTSSFNTEPILNDINNFVNITTPLINNFISSSINSNSTIRLDPTQINNQINNRFNNIINNLNPILRSFGNFNSN